MLEAGQDIAYVLRFLGETAPHARVQRVVGESCAMRSATAVRWPMRWPAIRTVSRGSRAHRRGGRHTRRLHLDRLASRLEREPSLKAGIISAVIYPILLVIAAIGWTLLLPFCQRSGRGGWFYQGWRHGRNIWLAEAAAGRVLALLTGGGERECGA